MEQDEVKILLDNLERELKRLRMEYNRFLANAPDVNLEFAEKRVKDLVSLLQRTAFKKYVFKFRFENLLARYNVMRMNFNRLTGIQEKKLGKVKDRLDGERGAAAFQENREIGDPRESGNVLRMRGGPEQEQDLETFYSRYVELKTMHEGLVTLSYEDFEQKITARQQDARRRGRAGELEVKLVEEGGKVKIKTKVIK